MKQGNASNADAAFKEQKMKTIVVTALGNPNSVVGCAWDGPS